MYVPLLTVFGVLESQLEVTKIAYSVTKYGDTSTRCFESLSWFNCLLSELKITKSSEETNTVVCI